MILWFLIGLLYTAADAVALGDPCTSVTDCTDTVANSVCIDEAGAMTCSCNDGYTKQGDVCKAKITETCIDASDCIPNTVCGSPLTCQCATDFTSNTDQTKCLKKITKTCANVADCIPNTVCSGDPLTCQCAAGFTSTTDQTKCLKNLGVACATNADCGSKVCDTTRTISVCAIGITDACAGSDADKCVLNAECTSTCSCKSGFTETGKLCIGTPGSACEASSGCAGNDVCDTNANPVACALASGDACDAKDSKCMTHSECTEDTCTCSNGGADETTKLCPAPNSVALGDTCTAVTDCTASVANSMCKGDTGAMTCSCADGYPQQGEVCKANLGITCATNAECGSEVCDSTRTSSICALGAADACAGSNVDKCVLNAECMSTCSCKSGYTATSKLCIGAPGSACEASSGCSENEVCDTNANPVTCALASGDTCDADDSKCMTHSECTEDTCTCSNGGADETTKLCPAPNGGFRETSSMLVLAAYLWLSMF